MNMLPNEAMSYIEEFAPLVKNTDAEVILCVPYTDLFYAKYVEFGTGIVGSKESHPAYSQKGWRYDINSHGEAGWKYPKKDGTYGWTRGQVAQKFVYQAVLDLERDYIEIAKNVLRKKGLI